MWTLKERRNRCDLILIIIRFNTPSRQQQEHRIQIKYTIQNKQTTIKTEHADISIKLSKLKEKYTNLYKYNKTFKQSM